MHFFFRHAGLMVGITACIGMGMVYPFLPGEYDRLAMTISTMLQVFGIAGLLLVAIGLLWGIYELRQAGRRQQNQPVTARGFYFALVALIVGSLVMFILAEVAMATGALSFGVVLLAIWLYILGNVVPRWRAMKQNAPKGINPAPLYLVALPLVALGLQLILAAPLTASSRTHAMTMSTEMIQAIEAYRTANGRYPDSLLAVWQDYTTGVVGVEQYHYEPQGEGYNLAFEQPRFLLDNIGAREFVVYNSRDEQRMISHNSWVLLFTPAELQDNQGWFEVHEAGLPHWKYFWFD